MMRKAWGTRLGFYLAAVGSACGLGNLWRFPYVVGQNGGGAFVLIYILLALVLGLPLLIGELILGKSTGKSLMSALDVLQGRWSKRLRWVGVGGIAMAMVILSYYAVISGWVLHFVTQLSVGLITGNHPSARSMMMILQNNGWLQVLLASVHWLFSVTVVLNGVQRGLERAVGLMMPVFGILVVILLYQTFYLPVYSSSSEDALRFMFYPDFSKLSLSSLQQAIGHVCFTLSVGFGTMVTFGSYLKTDENIPEAGFRLTVMDTCLSIVAGLLIFSVAIQAGNPSSTVTRTDSRLLFEVLPRFLYEIPGGMVFGFLFFSCLYLAALGGSIALLEVVVSNLEDRYHWPRIRATWACGFIGLVLSLGPALSSSSFSFVRYQGKGLLEILDGVLINWFLPIMALGISLVVSYGLSKVQKERFFVNTGQVETEALFFYWRLATKWVIPGLIVLGFAMRIFSAVAV